MHLTQTVWERTPGDVGSVIDGVVVVGSGISGGVGCSGAGREIGGVGSVSGGVIGGVGCMF